MRTPLGGAVLPDAHVAGYALLRHRSGEPIGEHVTVRRQGAAQLDPVAMDFALEVTLVRPTCVGPGNPVPVGLEDQPVTS